jgi:hypothetical protein
MAVLHIRTEPSGRTRILFDFRATGCDDEARIAKAMTACREGVPAAPSPRVKLQAASERRIKRPVTLPSRRRISAS